MYLNAPGFLGSFFDCWIESIGGERTGVEWEVEVDGEL